MASCDVALNCAIPSRFSREVDIDGTLKNILFTGSNIDSSNFPTSQLPEYDKNKTDYKIGDRVKVEAVKSEFICGIEGTRTHPMLSAGTEWKKLGSTNDFKFKDGSPHSQSIGDIDTDIEIELNLGKKGNFLFIQNIQGVLRIRVEAIESTTTTTVLHEEDTYKLSKFSPCDCCLIDYSYLTNFTLPLSPCSGYNRIKVTFTPVQGARVRCGVCAIGNYLEVGKFHDYPIPTIHSDFKFSLEEQGLALPANTNIYMNYSFTLEEVDTDFQNTVFRELIDSIGALNFYEITNFKNNMFTTFVGTHKGFKPKITNQHHTSIAIDIYGIPSIQEGGI